MNFLEETIIAIENSGHKVDDVIFIGSIESWHGCTWEEFEKLADFEYDSGFGAQIIAKDLAVIFKDEQNMLRGEYDGAEWWIYQYILPIPIDQKTITSLRVSRDQVGWKTLAEICGEVDGEHNDE